MIARPSLCMRIPTTTQWRRWRPTCTCPLSCPPWPRSPRPRPPWPASTRGCRSPTARCWTASTAGTSAWPPTSPPTTTPRSWSPWRRSSCSRWSSCSWRACRAPSRASCRSWPTGSRTPSPCASARGPAARTPPPGESGYYSLLCLLLARATSSSCAGALWCTSNLCPSQTRSSKVTIWDSGFVNPRNFSWQQCRGCQSPLQFISFAFM